MASYGAISVHISARTLPFVLEEDEYSLCPSSQELSDNE